MKVYTPAVGIYTRTCELTSATRATRASYDCSFNLSSLIKKKNVGIYANVHRIPVSQFPHFSW